MKVERSREETTRRRKLREVALKYRKLGYDVRADGIRGYDRPGPVDGYGFIPDIEATKQDSRILIEVKTLDSVVRDKEDLKRLATYAQRSKRTKLHVVLTKPKTPAAP